MFEVAAATAPAGTYPVNVRIAGLDVTLAIPLETLSYRESGNQQPGECSFTVQDRDMEYGGIANEQLVIIRHTASAREVFRGHIKSIDISIVANRRDITIRATDVAARLDTILVQYLNRPAGESDKERLAFLLGLAAGTGIQTTSTFISTLKASMPAQKFRNLTLRGAIEMVAAAASPNARYFVDPAGRLHYRSGLSTTTAPYQVRAGAPTTLIAPPTSLRITYDSVPLRTGYYVRAKVASASHLVIDTVAQDRYGVSRDYVDAPDATTWQMAEDVGRAALADNAYPVPRGSFSITSGIHPQTGVDYSFRNISGVNRYWEPDQAVTVISDFHGLPSSAPGVANIVGVDTRFLSGTGTFQQDIEFGGGRVRQRTVNRPAAQPVMGQLLSGDVGGAYGG